MATNLDVRFEEALAKDTEPARRSSSTRPARSRTRGGPEPARVAAAAVAVRGRASARPAAAGRRPRVGVSIPGVKTPSLPNLGPAPEFTDNQRWFNTPGGQPLTLAGLRGHVVLVDFWTYTCINCIRTLPFLKGLYATYHRYGLEIVGVETPEFTFEQEAGNVAAGDPAPTGIRYPVVQDNDYGTWNAYQNQYWPAEYLIDAHGEVRHTQFGEGDYRQDEAAVRAAALRGRRPQLPPPMTANAIDALGQLGDAGDLPRPDQRSQGFAQPLRAGRSLLPGRRRAAASTSSRCRGTLERQLAVGDAGV